MHIRICGDSLDWPFPTIPDRIKAFEEFSDLSLTSQRDGFISMPPPLRDYFSPKDPKLSPLLCMTKERYLTLMSANAGPGDTMDCFRGIKRRAPARYPHNDRRGLGRCLECLCQIHGAPHSAQQSTHHSAAEDRNASRRPSLEAGVLISALTAVRIGWKPGGAQIIDPLLKH